MTLVPGVDDSTNDISSFVLSKKLRCQTSKVSSAQILYELSRIPLRSSSTSCRTAKGSNKPLFLTVVVERRSSIIVRRLCRCHLRIGAPKPALRRRNTSRGTTSDIAMRIKYLPVSLFNLKPGGIRDAKSTISLSRKGTLTSTDAAELSLSQ